jgi:hypothetical protein
MPLFNSCIFQVLFSDFVFSFFSIGNKIGNEGAESIAEALRVNASLQELDLDCIV